MLKLENVQKHYKGFDLNCSLEVPCGCITGLVGPNGAGKSTTFKALLNLISPDSGNICILGKAADALTPADKQNIGVVLSDSGFSGYLTIRNIISILKTSYPDFRADFFKEYCTDFHLPENKPIKEFSTGMKAKLKILIALSHNADLLILDEPTAGLDVIARDSILNLLREYMEKDGRSILISSHISQDLESLCDDIYLIHNGNIILHEETDVLLGNYGLLKLSDEQFSAIDKQYILRSRKEPFGYSCLTNEKQFYLENYPGIAVEHGSIDNLITMMIRGE